MTEEGVTISVLKYLKNSGWDIISFDYPQSGTGNLIKTDLQQKNLGGFIPDIVAIKNNTVLFWENKDRFVYKDFLKIKTIKSSSKSMSSIYNFLLNYKYSHIFFGIAVPSIQSEINKCMDYLEYVDFIVSTNGSDIVTLYKNNKIIQI